MLPRASEAATSLQLRALYQLSHRPTPAVQGNGSPRPNTGELKLMAELECLDATSAVSPSQEVVQLQLSRLATVALDRTSI